MKRGIFILLLCLLLAGTASGLQAGTVLVKQTVSPALASATLRAAPVSFNATVTGAVVYIDGKLAGSDEAASRTPVTISDIAAGNHTATFRHDGYKDYTTKFSALVGKPQVVAGILEPLPSTILKKEVVTVTVRKVEAAKILPVSISTTVTTSTPPTTSPLVICSGDYSCMSEAAAIKQFGSGNYSRVPDSPCGYEKAAPTGLSMPKYCFAGRSIPQKVALAPALVAIHAPVTTETVIPNPPVEPAGVMKAESPDNGSGGFLGSLFGMFGGLFGKPAPRSPGFESPAGTMPDPALIHPVNSYRVATTIEKGATVYIGEENLNVTHALNGARLLEVYHVGALDETPSLTRIGYFSSDPFTTSPTRTVDLSAAGGYRSMLVSPADFVGYTGTWYLLNSEGTSPYSHSAVVFTVMDPQIDLAVTNAKTGTSVSGTTVSAGDQLRFSITKNIGVAGTTGDLRGPITDTVSDGFMDIVVTAPGGMKLTQLDVIDGGSPGVASLSRPCWDLPADSACNPTWAWNTGAMYSNGTAKYRPGTYTVQVISKLNNMHNNYRQAGALYEGKTASHTITFKLK